MLLYHVTPARNAQGILKDGVVPGMAKSTCKRSWFVDDSRLLWAIAHTSSRWTLPTCGLAVITLDVCGRNVRRWSLSGVYYSKSIETVVLRVERVDETYLNNLIGLSEPKGE